jgi:glycosyltransferase involved in cell wall biosynthesis
VKNQNYPRVEVIIVNDGSSDTRYQDLGQFSGVKVVHLDPSSRQCLGFPCAAYVRNRGVERARGKYLAFCDDDDVWTDTMKLTIQLRRMYQTGCLMSATSAVCGFGRYEPPLSKYQRMNEERFWETISSKYPNEEWDHQFPQVWTHRFLKVHNCVVCSSVVLDKALFFKVGGMPLKQYGEDYDCWIKALRHTDCVYIQKPKVYYDLAHGK